MRDAFITDALMPFGEHLDELRKRLIYALAGVLPIFVVALVFGQTIMDWMIQPLLQSQLASGMAQKMQAVKTMETFNTYLKVSFISTMVVGAPWILYQFWLFVSPGLYLKERRFVHILTPLSFVLTISGVAFMFKVMLPIMLAFFVTFGTGIVKHDGGTAPLPPGVALQSETLLWQDPTDPPVGSSWINLTLRTRRFALPGKDGGIEIYEQPLTKNSVIDPMFTIGDYTSLILGMTLAFALAFQMPVAVLLLGWVGIVEPRVLGKYRRHAVFACGMAGAIVTPTGDPLSMFLLAGPLYALYELGVVMLRLLPASRIIKAAESADARRSVAQTETAGGRNGAAGQPRAGQRVVDPEAAHSPESHADPAPAVGAREPDSDDEH